ncbi:hypothetical protein NHX12_006226 [Muraenolepis orangiensis]|uniref:Uncharacterized protein n=1 Tax=Muraenolepis orangiensis TaxID=630683 RepID=A0A9Q0IDL1_9TELE|nr:hypothetical protein NHX12_006226 [Muraenolepis orangiensis]
MLVFKDTLLAGGVDEEPRRPSGWRCGRGAQAALWLEVWTRSPGGPLAGGVDEENRLLSSLHILRPARHLAPPPYLFTQDLALAEPRNVYT